jgi:hypothetical protein
MNLSSKTANLVNTRFGILGIFKKPGLVDEALGTLSDLTPDKRYHHCLTVKIASNNYE